MAFATAIGLLTAFDVSASSVDADGMPIVYLRGDFRNTGWKPDEAYRFIRNGNDYTLTITGSNAIGKCRFKIADDEWDLCNIGADVSVNHSQHVKGEYGGSNMSTDGLSDCVISFTYSPRAERTDVKFVIDGAATPLAPGISGTLPVLFINVYADEAHTTLDNEVISKDLSHKEYFKYSEYWLDTNGCRWLEELGAENVGSEYDPLPLQIKARGNWTRIGFSKKPFKIKLDKKQPLLGLSSSKHFALLAHADDYKGYLRNFVGFDLGHRIGLPWTPSQQPVEVVINGDYRGLYFLTESIRVEKERVDIAELGDNEEDSSLVSGGYIVELDNYDESYSSQIKMEEKHIAYLRHNFDALRITFDTPEEYSYLQRQFITDQFTSMNDFVGANDDRLWSYMDLDDAARYYIVEELVSHTESYHGSTYLFRDRGEGRKWHFSPLWDFGNAFSGSTSDYFYNCDPYGNTWIPSMRENRKFNEKVRATWLWFMANEYEGIEEDIDAYVGHISEAARADYRRWNGEPRPSGGSDVADNRDMETKRMEVTAHLNAKVNWLRKQFGDFTSGSFEEPERDDTPAAPLPSYVTTDMIELISVNGDDSQTEYYNLQGIRVTNPSSGTIYIVRRGNKAFKAIIR